MVYLRAVVAVLATAVVAMCAIPADQITSLPGWTGPLPSVQYSGYLPVPDGFLHYWFITSQNNPTTDPVLLWLNGGPGSSSLIGLLTENGPFHTSDLSLTNETNGVPTLQYNPYTWAQNHSVLYLEQPKGVGFSYCTVTPCINNDTSMATDAYAFLVAFFDAYPEFSKNDFYITGESYAGIYIPLIMEQIDLHGGINLKGAAIGDGCIGNDVGSCGTGLDSDQIMVEFYQGHGMYPQTLYQQIQGACGDFTTASAECIKYIAEMYLYIGNFDIYNIYDTCGTLDQVTLADFKAALSVRDVIMTNHNDAFRRHPQFKQAGGALNDYPCGAETVMSDWLNVPAVQEALHVKPNNQLFHYRQTAANLLPLYAELIAKYRILIYSGDVDACVPYWGSELWTREMGYEIVEPWRPWNSRSTGDNPTNIKAGYVIHYGGKNATDFYFLTVNGAGHMVPQFKPIPAYDMITRFIAGTRF